MRTVKASGRIFSGSQAIEMRTAAKPRPISWDQHQIASSITLTQPPVHTHLLAKPYRVEVNRPLSERRDPVAVPGRRTQSPAVYRSPLALPRQMPCSLTKFGSAVLIVIALGT